MVIRPEKAPDERQLALITQQLGRAPRGIQTVSAATQDGIPLVLRMHAIVDDKPFPTHFWLCSDHLKIAISRIEAQGVIKALESCLQEEVDFMAAYRRSHEDYVAQRWQTMSDAERDIVDRHGYHDLFTRRGIGGIANWDQVRCLHMQYAHHLCGDNAIGRWMDAEYDVLACLR